MAREINDTQPYSDKLVKFIPTEIVGAYLMLAGFLGFGPGVSSITDVPKINDVLILVVFFFFLALVPVYLWIVSNVRHIIQIAVATISFAVWVYSLGGPFEVWGLQNPTIASVILVLWTFVPPLLIPPSPVQPSPPQPPQG